MFRNTQAHTHTVKIIEEKETVNLKDIDWLIWEGLKV